MDKDLQPIERAMIADVAKYGGEYTYETVKGKIQDIHYQKDLGGRVPKVPKPPKGAGLMKS